MVVLTLCLPSCQQSDTQSAKEPAEQASAAPAAPSIPDPSGTYSDSDGGLTYTFLSTGKFYSELLGETTFGTWNRNGNEVEVVYDDGNSLQIDLGDGYITVNGLRLTK